MAMSEEEKQPQLSPPSAIQNLQTMASGSWFDYPVRVQPHHTDYGSVAWHGSYIAWMEEARVECLRSIGIEFADLVALGCDLPVVELSVRYHRALPLGKTAVVRVRMAEIDGVRLNWDHQIQSLDGQELYVTARVALVAVDQEKGKVMRQLPPAVQDALARLAAQI